MSSGHDRHGLNGLIAGAAFAGVYAAALANGGSFGNIQPGIDYFKKLHQAGNFVPVTGSAATMESGQTPIWKYAPDPAAARLWEEYLYSTEGQNLWLEGKARLIELPTLVANGRTRTRSPSPTSAPPRTACT